MSTLHAHISTRSRDCDGTYLREYVEVFNDDERAESGKAYNDFSEIHFMQRVMIQVASPFAVEHGMRVTVDDEGIEVHENTDEGFREATVVWCRADDDEEPTIQRDLAAEAAGY